MKIDYFRFANYVNTILQFNDLTNFKSHPDFTYMLEHVSPEHGKKYKECIEKETGLTNEEIVNFCRLNDSIGNTNKIRYSDSLYCSPSSLRYIWQAYLALKHFYLFDTEINIVELGGGYGGLCLAVNMIAQKIGIKVNSYTIIDLDAPNRLQEVYLSRFSLSFPVKFMRASTYGADIQQKNLYFISNYCFSEIDSEHQKKYIEILFPKVVHGFIAWNHIPVFDFGFRIFNKPEEPNTGGTYNRYVYF